MDSRDRELGLGRPISRRDFIDGVAVAVGAGLVARGASAAEREPPAGPAAPQAGASLPSPPARLGLRGSHDGSFEVAHALKDGVLRETLGAAEDTGERYELVVVGGGISGLAAAHFHRARAGGRVLVLENHDDFGGHARRNELRDGERLVLSYGGSQSIESPGSWSPVAIGLLRELGVDTDRFYQAFDRELYPSLDMGNGIFFDGRRWGRDHLASGVGRRPWSELLAGSPLSEAARRDLARIYDEKIDYLPGLGAEQKWRHLASTSYRRYLAEDAGVGEEALAVLQDLTHDLWAVGVDAVEAAACSFGGDDYGWVYPGFSGLGLDPGGAEAGEPCIFHFPDGNASIARLLVRSLIPDAVPGGGMDDVVTAQVDYARLDREGSPVRLRLSSTVVGVRHAGEPGSSGVEVRYVKDGRHLSLRADACVLACWNRMIPHLCPELPSEQREALAYGVKAPLVYTNVLLSNWEAFRRLGVHLVYAPGSYFPWLMLDFPVSLGEYRFARDPSEPIPLFLLRTPCQPGLPTREQHAAGRMELLATPFETFERELREQLQRLLGPAGFEAARDVRAIAVNRWPHGYAYGYNRLWDPELPEERLPHVLGRKRFGRIAIAGSDAAASAYCDAAIDQAHRAVGELLESG
jgi:spermidine dehydrogenase